MYLYIVCTVFSSKPIHTSGPYVRIFLQRGLMAGASSPLFLIIFLCALSLPHPLYYFSDSQGRLSLHNRSLATGLMHLTSNDLTIQKFLHSAYLQPDYCENIHSFVIFTQTWFVIIEIPNQRENDSINKFLLRESYL